MTQPQTPFETPGLDEAIRTLTSSIVSRSPEERETLTRELLLLKEQLWPTPFYKKINGGDRSQKWSDIFCITGGWPHRCTQ